MKYNTIDITALILVIIGAVNWGLIGFFKFDLVAFLLGGMDSWLSRIVYAIVGLAGLYSVTFFGRSSSKNQNLANTH